MLKTKKNTKETERQVLRAARTHLGLARNSPNRYIEAHFEHGQWWIVFHDYTNPDEPQQTYSVCDASGGNSVDGFSFELVS
jgi:hypothetical protein